MPIVVSAPPIEFGTVAEHLNTLQASCNRGSDIVRLIAESAAFSGTPASLETAAALNTALAEGSDGCKLSALWQYTSSFLAGPAQQDSALVKLLREVSLACSLVKMPKTQNFGCMCKDGCT